MTKINWRTRQRLAYARLKSFGLHFAVSSVTLGAGRWKTGACSGKGGGDGGGGGGGGKAFLFCPSSFCLRSFKTFLNEDVKLGR